MNQDPAATGASWTHSFEEDEGAVRVYRPTVSFPFPPSRRGRETLQFTADGQLSVGAPGPDDRPRSTARLPALGMNRFGAPGSQAGQVVEIVEATPQRLKVRFV